MLDFNYDGLLPFKISIFVMPGHISFHHADIYFSNKVDNYNYALLYKLFFGIGDDVVFIILACQFPYEHLAVCLQISRRGW